MSTGTVVLFILLGLAAIAGAMWLIRQLESDPGQADDADGAHKTESEKISFPYQRVDRLLSEAESRFLCVLEDALLGSGVRVMCKVRLADLVAPKRGLDRSAWAKARNRIERKHVDFVLVGELYLEPKLVIELDDASHRHGKRRPKGDVVKDQTLRAAGLPIARVPARASYDVSEVRSMLRAAATPERRTGRACHRRGNRRPEGDVMKGQVLRAAGVDSGRVAVATMTTEPGKFQR